MHGVQGSWGCMQGGGGTLTTEGMFTCNVRGWSEEHHNCCLMSRRCGPFDVCGPAPLRLALMAAQGVTDCKRVAAVEWLHIMLQRCMMQQAKWFHLVQPATS